MNYRYYPGCTLKDKAKIMEETALKSAELLGFHLTELDEWQCCGAVFPLSDDEIITLLSPARTIAAAGKDPLVTLCSACHHVLKRTRERLLVDVAARDKVNDFLGNKEFELNESRVIHFLELIKDDLGFDRLAEKVKNPLENLRVASYYGCMLLRPAPVMQFDNPENPGIMEDFFKALYAEPVYYPYRTECCGGYISVTDKNVAMDTSMKIYESALDAGADVIATACPMCVYNLNKAAENNKKPDKIKVVYFTELLAKALGIDSVAEVEN